MTSSLPTFSQFSTLQVRSVAAFQVRSGDEDSDLELVAKGVGTVVVRDEVEESSDHLGLLRLSPVGLTSVRDPDDDGGGVSGDLVFNAANGGRIVFNGDTENNTPLIVGPLTIRELVGPGGTNEEEQAASGFVQEYVHNDPVFPKAYMASGDDDLVLAGSNEADTHVLTIGELKCYQRNLDGTGVALRVMGRTAADPDVPATLSFGAEHDGNGADTWMFARGSDGVGVELRSFGAGGEVTGMRASPGFLEVATGHETLLFTDTDEGGGVGKVTTMGHTGGVLRMELGSGGLEVLGGGGVHAHGGLFDGSGSPYALVSDVAAAASNLTTPTDVDAAISLATADFLTSVEIADAFVLRDELEAGLPMPSLRITDGGANEFRIEINAEGALVIRKFASGVEQGVATAFDVE